MITKRDRLDLPYTPRQVYDLVADIESYPAFVPHIASARILRRDGNALWVAQTVRLSMLRLPFTTHAVLEPPTRIRIATSDNPWGSFRETWNFVALPEGGTELTCVTDFDFRAGLANRVAGTAFTEIHHATLRAFAARARALYGTGR